METPGVMMRIANGYIGLQERPTQGQEWTRCIHSITKCKARRTRLTNFINSMYMITVILLMWEACIYNGGFVI